MMLKNKGENINIFTLHLYYTTNIGKLIVCFIYLLCYIMEIHYLQEVVLLDLIYRNRNFRLLLSGSLISSFGDYLYEIAITLLLYDLTKSIDTIAYMWISKGAFRILILYWGGIITDHYNRKHIITLINYISAPIALMFIFTNWDTLWVAYLGIFLLQSLNDIDNCSESAILPELVSKDDIAKANTIFSFTNHTLMLISLALSGLIYKLAGAKILFTLNASSFLAAGIFFQFIYYIPNCKAAVAKMKILDTSVFKLLKESMLVLMIIVSSIPIAIVGRIYDVTNIIIADSKLNVTSAGIIYFRYAIAIGGFLTPILLKLKSGSTPNRYAASSIALVLCIAVFALSKQLWLTLLILAAFGFSGSLQGIYFRSLLQENTNTDYLGRVFSFYRIVMTAVSLATVALIPAANKLYKIEFIYIFTIVPSIAVFLYVFIWFKSKQSQTSAEISINE